MKRYAKYIKQTKRLKVNDAKIISAKSIVTAEWVRFKCRFGCDGYGQTLMCPPNSPTPDETRKMLTYYKYALLIHGDENTDITRIVSILEKNIFLDGYYKACCSGSICGRGIFLRQYTIKK